MNAQSSSGSSDTVTDILMGIAIVVLLYIGLATAEFIYKSIMSMWVDKVELFPDTYASGTRMFTAIQNPRNPAAKTANLSDNQRSGVEFSYAMFVFLKSECFASGEQKLLHILHKGYNKPYPLMAPGIFTWGNKNTIRIFMNSYDSWNNWSEVENIPVDKWFHLVVSCKGNTLFVYINGSLKQKVTLSGNTPPYQNYGDVYLFSPRKMAVSKTITTSLASDPEFKGMGSNSSLQFGGAASGMVSRVYYFSYALSYTEIQKLMNMGPSSVMSGPDMSMTPYLSDTWWVNAQGP
jgi:hypothetical protein